MDLSTLMPQQLEIVKTFDEPLFVSAGAGSGKTFTLTRRIVWALSPESGPYLSSIDELLAITFTNKAAAELRERIRAALIDEGMVEEALKVDGAWISTIHGMCARIIRAHALDLGVDPEFSMLPNEEAEKLRAEALDEVLAAEDVQRSLGDLLRCFDLRPAEGSFGSSSVYDMALALAEKAAATVGGFDAIEPPSYAYDLDDLANAYRGVLKDAKPKSATAAACTAALDALDGFDREALSAAGVVQLCEQCPCPRASGALKAEIKALKALRAETFLSLLAATAEPAARQLFDLARRLSCAYDARKAARSLLDNNDLLRIAYEALVGNDEVREAFAGRFKLVMVDEFQDTATQQVRLIERLMHSDARELCTVGDAKQSIYRFRGADVSVFLDQERRIAGGSLPGTRVSMARNFRSHAAILDYVTQVFEERGDGFDIMPGYEALEPSPSRKDGFAAQGASRRQAVLVAGGTADERAEAKARAIAERFCALARQGQDPSGMVVLLGVMKNASRYADAIRAAGLPCVIAGGSVFSSSVEAGVVGAALRFIADPADAKRGVLALLVSPMFGLGAQELLALTTEVLADGSTRRRNVEAIATGAPIDPSFGDLPLLARAAEVLEKAARAAGSAPVPCILRRMVNESGWLARLEAQGAEGQAAAANVLKALGIVDSMARGRELSPRQVSRAYEAYLADAKEAPGALTGGAGGAVRIMTAHASKGLEFPVVAVADCCSVRSSSDKLVLLDRGGSVDAALVPAHWGSRDADKLAEKLKADARALRKEGVEAADDTAFGRYLELSDENRRLDLAEQARLLYVAMTRAKEALLLVLDAGVQSGSRAQGELKLSRETDLTGPVLARILPKEGIAGDRLAYEGSQAGDFELVALKDVSFMGVACPASDNAAEEVAAPSADGSAEELPFELFVPGEADARIVPAEPAPRESYSYTSLAHALGEASEDRVDDEVRRSDDEEATQEPSDRICEDDATDPLAFGSAFHVLAQWLVETRAASVPPERVCAQMRAWGLDDAQRARLERALARWEGSAVRARALAWPRVQAEVPFFSAGESDFSHQGAYAEGSIDLLCTDPARPGAALVIDYKTGGCPGEDPAALAERHRLQARVYAAALAQAGYEDAELVFVRVEQDDPACPGEPQTVCYRSSDLLAQIR